MTKTLLAKAVDFDTLIPSVFDNLGAHGISWIDLSKPGLTLGQIISAFLPYIFIIAGLILFGLLIIGGFGLLTSAGNPEKTKSSQGQIISALVGFLIIFLAYWLTQILEIVFGITIF